MSEVTFNEDDVSKSLRAMQADKPVGGMTGFLIKKGIVKDVAQANLVLLGIAIVVFCISGFVVYSSSHSSNAPVEDMPQATP
jgi:hypothetical protein